MRMRYWDIEIEKNCIKKADNLMNNRKLCEDSSVLERLAKFLTLIRHEE